MRVSNALAKSYTLSSSLLFLFSRIMHNQTENVHLFACPRSGELRTQKLKSHLVRTKSLNVLPFKPGAGQYIAIHATLTAKDFFPAYFYPFLPFRSIHQHFFQNLFRFFPVLAVANTDSCAGPQNKISHPVGCRFLC